MKNLNKKFLVTKHTVESMACNCATTCSCESPCGCTDITMALVTMGGSSTLLKGIGVGDGATNYQRNTR